MNFQRRVVLAVAFSAPLWCASLGSAGAQTGYPGPTSTVPPQPTEARQNAGQVRPGEAVTTESCGFTANTPTEVRFNDTLVHSENADATGCVDVVVAVRDDCPGVTVDGEPLDGRRGRNELAVSGVGANGATRQVFTGVTVSCSQPGGPAAASGSTSNRSAEGGGDPGATVQNNDASTGDLADVVSAAAATSTQTATSRATAVGALLAGVGCIGAFAELRRRRRRAAL